MNTKHRNKITQKTKPQQKKPTSKVEKNSISKWVWIALSVVFVTTFIVYFKAIGFGFLDWDDTTYISNNQDIKNLSWANIKIFFTEFFFANYQPVTLLFYALEHKIGAGNASIYHLNNIILHILNTYLVFVLIKRISPKSNVVALITAAFFAVHPMHVESVAWISERKDVLYSFFFLLSLIMYTDYLNLHKIKYLIYAAIFFVLSCLSKSAAVITPLIMLLFDYYCNRKYNWKMIIEKVPFFTISLIFGIIAIYSQKGVVRDYTFSLTIFERMSITSYSFINYILKAFVPIHLSAIYPYPIKTGESLPLLYSLAPFGVGLILVLIFQSRKWGKEIVFGFLFFVISIILVLQFFPVGDATMADRYTYIPYIGIFFLVGKLYEYLLLSNKRSHTKYKSYLFFVLLSGLILFSFSAKNRVKIWENEESLFGDVIIKFPTTSLAYNNIGYKQLNVFALKEHKQNPVLKNMYLEKAEYNFTKAIQFAPTFVLFQLNRGITRFYRGNFKDAIDDINKYISIFLDNAEAYNFKGKAMGSTGDFHEAITNFTHAIKINPKYLEAYGNRSIAKYQIKDLIGTIQDCEDVLKLNPNNENALNLKIKAQQELPK